MKWRQETRLCRDPATVTGKNEKGTENFIFYKFDGDVAALSIVELVKYNQDQSSSPSLVLWCNESKYPGTPFFSAILVTPVAFDSDFVLHIIERNFHSDIPMFHVIVTVTCDPSEMVTLPDFIPRGSLALPGFSRTF